MAAAMPSAIQRGTPAYLRANLALFLAGFATFSLLYCVQPLLPAFAKSFRVSPAESSLAMSLSIVSTRLRARVRLFVLWASHSAAMSGVTKTRSNLIA